MNCVIPNLDLTVATSRVWNTQILVNRQCPTL